MGRWLKEGTDLVRGGLVEGYERWASRVQLPDPDDVHVVAAAIESGATTIVTSNLKNFPGAELTRHSTTAVDPDTFVMACIAANPVIAERIVSDLPDSYRLLATIEQELPRAAHRLRSLIS